MALVRPGARRMEAPPVQPAAPVVRALVANSTSKTIATDMVIGVSSTAGVRKSCWNARS